jgi:hypothetical protein
MVTRLHVASRKARERRNGSLHPDESSARRDERFSTPVWWQKLRNDFDGDLATARVWEALVNLAGLNEGEIVVDPVLKLPHVVRLVPREMV